MQSEETDGIAAYLSGLAADRSSAQPVAEAVELTLRSIEQVLTPIVGALGVAALYKRSVHLSRSAYGWLPDSPSGPATSMDAGPLVAALAQQSAADAALAGARLLRNFHDLLVTLIGPSLTERLLRSVWVNFMSGPSAQDNTQ
ncbi:hypothetical protein [Rhizobacter fulvus]|jgi:hypothetical protein